jgi:hypothetical protein
MELKLEFNELVKTMVMQLSTKAQTPEVERLKTRTLLAIRSVPLDILENAAPFIWKHRKDIINAYNNGDYQWDIIDTIKIDIPESDESAYIAQMINIIRETINLCNEMEKIDICNNLIRMLEITAEYRKIYK